MSFVEFEYGHDGSDGSFTCTIECVSEHFEIKSSTVFNFKLWVAYPFLIHYLELLTSVLMCL